MGNILLPISQWCFLGNRLYIISLQYFFYLVNDAFNRKRKIVANFEKHFPFTH